MFEFRVKKTADFYESVTIPVSTKTISFWKSQIYVTPITLPVISLRGVSESNTSSNKFVVDEFITSIENIDELRGEVKGAEEIIVSGEIISHIENRRFASVP